MNFLTERHTWNEIVGKDSSGSTDCRFFYLLPPFIINKYISEAVSNSLHQTAVRSQLPREHVEITPPDWLRTTRKPVWLLAYLPDLQRWPAWALWKHGCLWTCWTPWARVGLAPKVSSTHLQQAPRHLCSVQHPAWDCSQQQQTQALDFTVRVMKKSVGQRPVQWREMFNNDSKHFCIFVYWTKVCQAERNCLLIMEKTTRDVLGTETFSK